MTQIFRYSFFIVLILSLLVSCKKDDPEVTVTESLVPTPVIPTPAKSKTVLLVVTSNNQLNDGSPAGYFLPEAIDFYKALKKAGYKIVIASPAGGKAPMYERTMYVNQYRTYLDTSGLLSQLDSTITLASVKVSDYRAVCYVGGFACLFDFPGNAHIQRITRGIYESGGIVAAVCHAPAALLNITLSDGRLLIKDKKLTARSMAEETDNGALSREDVLFYFPFILEEELKAKHCIFSNAGIGQPYAVTDGRLVTGQNPESTRRVAQVVVELLVKP